MTKAIQLDLLTNLEGASAASLLKAVEGHNGDRAAFERTLDATDAPRKLLKLFNAWKWGKDNPAATKAEAGAQKGQKQLRKKEKREGAFSPQASARYRKLGKVPRDALLKWGRAYLSSPDSSPILKLFESSDPYTLMERKETLESLAKPSFNHADGAQWTRAMTEWLQCSAVVDFMERGYSVPEAVRKAERRVSNERTSWEAIQAAHERKAKGEPDGPVIHCACRELIAHVEKGSLDAVFTDPPYPKEFIHTWTELGEFAQHALKPGGLLLALSGQLFLPDVIQRLLDEGLEYRWTVSYCYAKPRGNIHASKVSVGWKPALAFRKPGPQPDFYSEDAFKAVPRTSADKANHEWGQTVADMTAIANEWLRPGWRIADPFCGAGALLVAAQSMGCEVIGGDIEEQHVQRTIEALKEATK